MPPFWSKIPDARAKNVNAEDVVSALPADNPPAKVYADGAELRGETAGGARVHTITRFVLDRAETYHFVRFGHDQVMVMSEDPSEIAEPYRQSDERWFRAAHDEKAPYEDVDYEDDAGNLNGPIAAFLHFEASMKSTQANRFVNIGGAGKEGHMWLPEDVDPTDATPLQDFELRDAQSGNVINAGDATRGISKLAETLEQLDDVDFSAADRRTWESLHNNATVDPGEISAASAKMRKAMRQTERDLAGAVDTNKIGVAVDNFESGVNEYSGVPVITPTNLNVEIKTDAMDRAVESAAKKISAAGRTGTYSASMTVGGSGGAESDDCAHTSDEDEDAEERTYSGAQGVRDFYDDFRGMGKSVERYEKWPETPDEYEFLIVFEGAPDVSLKGVPEHFVENAERAIKVLNRPS